MLEPHSRCPKGTVMPGSRRVEDALSARRRASGTQAGTHDTEPLQVRGVAWVPAFASADDDELAAARVGNYARGIMFCKIMR